MRTIAMPKMAFLVACGLLLAGVSGASLAGPIVTAWEYENDAKFDAASFTQLEDIYGTEIQTDYELSWGATGGTFVNPPPITGRSAVTIGSGTAGTITGGGPATGSVNTIFGAGPPTTASQIGIGINISHWNNRIWSGYDELLSGNLLDSLTLTPTTGGSTIYLPPLIYSFVFDETINRPSELQIPGTCPGGTPEPCADLFGILGIPDLNPRFVYDGQVYQADILLLGEGGGVAPIAPLLNEECSTLGLNYGCLGWRTKEDATTTVQFAFTIRAIPEPSTLALFSLGLAGFGYRRYKARAV